MTKPIKITEKQIKDRFTKWVKNHTTPDSEHFWYAQNAIGELLGWPDWWSKFVKEFENTKSLGGDYKKI